MKNYEWSKVRRQYLACLPVSWLDIQQINNTSINSLTF